MKVGSIFGATAFVLIAHNYYTKYVLSNILLHLYKRMNLLNSVCAYQTDDAHETGQK